MKFFTKKKFTSLLLLVMLVLQFIGPRSIQANEQTFKHRNQIVDGECERTIEGKANFTLPEEKKHVDLVIVQDASGSFESTIDHMKEALRELIDILEPEDRAMVISYKGADRVLYKGYQYGFNLSGKDIRTEHELSSDFDSIKLAIENISVAGATPTALGLKHVLDNYRNEDPHRETIVLLVTDGIANVHDDGNIWINPNRYNSLDEQYQDYQGAIENAENYVRILKNQGYHLVTTFIEDVRFLQTQYPNNYDIVGEYSRDKLKSMASSEEYYQRFDDPGSFQEKMTGLLSDLREKLTKSRLSVYVEDGYIVKEAKLYRNGQVIEDNLKLETGENNFYLENTDMDKYILEYTLQETELFTESKVPVKVVLENNQTLYEIENPEIEGNMNARCKINNVTPNKTVNQKEHHDLNLLDEVFEYSVDMPVGYLYNLETFRIEDEVDPLLTILEDTVRVTVDGEDIEGKLSITDNKIRFVKENHFDAIEKKTVQLTFKAKVKENISYKDILNQYPDAKIPNTATLYLDNNPKQSNTVTVKAPEPLSITVEKQWIHGPEHKDPIEVVLYQGTEEFEKVTLSEENNWTYTWDELPKVDAEGNQYRYSVDEIDVPKNYKKEVDGFIIKNTYVSPQTDLTVTKEWVNGPDEKPSVDIVLKRDDAVIDTITLDGSEDWEYTWTDLAVTDENGKEYVYTVDEVNVPANYEKEVDGFTIKNTYVSPQTDITVTKEWVNGPDEKPSVDIVLKRDDAVIDTITLDGSEDWEYTWTDLAVTDENGKEYVYTVDEVNVPENYEKEVDGFVIKNIYRSPETSVTVHKEWVGGPSERPSIQVGLYQNETLIDIVELNGEENWEYTWDHLPKTDDHGFEYIYEIDEISVPINYEKAIEGNTIVNTYVSPKTSVTTEKRWVQGPEEKPSVDIVLKRDGQIIDEVTLDASKGWKHTWNQLDLTDEDGKPYLYTVDEVNVPDNYEKEIDGYLVTNHYVSPKTEVTARKEWLGGPEEKPQVEVVLYQNGKQYSQAVLTQDNGWEHTWDNLDLTDDNGEKYIYTIDEVNVPDNYEKEVDGFTIKNTYISPKTDVTVTKTWVDAPENKPSIEIVLYRNGERIDTVILDGREGWTHTWSDLDVTDGTGQEYIYSVDEIDVPKDYIKTVNGFDIENRYFEEVEEVRSTSIEPTSPEITEVKGESINPEVEEIKEAFVLPSTGVSSYYLGYVLSIVLGFLLFQKKKK